MAKKKLQKSEEEEEEQKKVPVFTVLKNGSIVKNIFLLENPPPSLDKESIKVASSCSSDSDVEEDEEKVENLIVGRHPNCNIVLEHPSISRFHLRILLKPSSQKLSLIDLSSVHGTWVSDRKIEPDVLTDLNEGESLRLGSSTRIYRLHWVPLNRVFDIENPLIFSEHQNRLPVEEIEQELEENNENVDSALDQMHLTALNREIRIEDDEYVNENECPASFLREQNNIPSAPPLSQSMNTSFAGYDYEEVPFAALVSNDEENQFPSSVRDNQSPSVIGEYQNPFLVGGNESPLRSLDQWSALSVTSSPLPAHLETSNQLFDKENQLQQAFSAIDILSEQENQESTPIKLDRESDTKNISARKVQSPATQQFDNEGVNQQALVARDLRYELDDQGSLPRKSERKSNTKSCWSIKGKSPGSRRFNEENQNNSQALTAMAYETVNSPSNFSVDRVPPKTTNQQLDKENQNLQALDDVNVLSELENLESPPRKLEQKSDTLNIWSRRGKSACSIQVQTGRSRAKDMEQDNTNAMEKEAVCKVLFSTLHDGEIYTPDKENVTPNPVFGSKSAKKVRLEEVKVPFPGLDDGEKEIFTPDKENMTPKSALGSKSRKKSRLEEIKYQSYSGSPSKVVSDQDLTLEDGPLTSTDKENMTSFILRESNSQKSAPGSPGGMEAEAIMMRRREGRVPFQSLLPKSTSQSKSEFWVTNSTAATRSSSSVNCSQTIEKNFSSSQIDQSVGVPVVIKRWNMVVDTSCLLNKDSLKSLQLLQGLKGTHLIIPRMVIRELDCLKNRGSLFRRSTEVSSVLEWIEECMVQTKWWIHVQNSLEENMPFAPTPPASPRFNEGSSGAFSRYPPFSTCGSLMEIVSPTAQDHILDCALLFKRLKNDEQLVLLSNDVSLKIKAMAEGLICETAEEFRRSLVNPFADRFLWAESTPRGATWSSLDEAAGLRENYCYQFPVQKTAKAHAEGAKGLKLILLHNSSHYEQMSSVI